MNQPFLTHTYCGEAFRFDEFGLRDTKPERISGAFHVTEVPEPGTRGMVTPSKAEMKWYLLVNGEGQKWLLPPRNALANLTQVH